MKLGNRILLCLLAGLLLLSAAGCAPAAAPAATAAPTPKLVQSTLKAGVYTASARGNGGDLTVEVAIGEAGIESVKVLSHSETAGVSDPAVERIPAAIVEHQSVAVDAVTGATITSKAICDAVADAIRQAGGDVANFSAAPEKTTAKAEEYTADVVVVGAGGSGLMAAVEAAEAGANVIVLEKSATPGGISSFGAGIGAVNSSMQQEANLTFTVEDVYGHMLKYTNATVYAPLLHTILKQSGETADWLKSEFGWDINVVTPNIWAGEVFDTYHLIYPYGPERFNPVIKQIEDAGAKLMLETEGKSLILEEGRPAGVIAQKADGTEVRVKAKAVVLATGGAIANPEILIQYTGSAEYFTMQPSLSDGAGIRMAQEAGAALTNELFVHASEIGMTPGVAPEPAFHINLLSVAALLMVNSNGDRYFNEALFREQPLNQGGAAASSMGAYYVIFDQKTYDMLVAGGLKELLPADEAEKQAPQLERLSFYGSTSGVPPMFAGANSPLSELPREMGFGIENGFVWKANSIKTLQDETGLADLSTTVARYNELVAAGEDTDLLKRDVYLIPIAEGPFYAVKFLPGCFGTLGGVKVNEKLQALDSSNKPIPGLYVAGQDGGSMYHKPYYDICGTTMMYAFGSGRIAGREAASYVK